MKPSTLIRAALRAVRDPEFAEQLLSDPGEASWALGLESDEAQELAIFTGADFEAMIGGFVARRLLPLPVGHKFLIVPEALQEPIESERMIIRLDQSRTGAWIDTSGTSTTAGMVFGSGSHPSTALVLAELDGRVRTGDEVLDLGAGTGVLSIAAAKLGASRVVACDIDEAAVQFANRNADANGVSDRVIVVLGSLQALRSEGYAGPYDVIVANILAPAHQQHLADGLSDMVAKGGSILLGGFRSEEVARLSENLNEHGIETVRVARSGPWAVIVGVKP